MSVRIDDHVLERVGSMKSLFNIVMGDREYGMSTRTKDSTEGVSAPIVNPSDSAGALPALSKSQRKDPLRDSI